MKKAYFVFSFAVVLGVFAGTGCITTGEGQGGKQLAVSGARQGGQGGKQLAVSGARQGGQGGKQLAVSGAKVTGLGMEKFNVWRSIGAIVCVLGGLLALNLALRKKTLGRVLRRGGNRRIKILERLTIDQRRQILIVEVDGQTLLVGAGGEGMNTLTVLKGEG